MPDDSRENAPASTDHDPNGSDTFSARDLRPALDSSPSPMVSPGDFASDAVFRALVEQVKDFAIFRIAPDGRAATWNEGVQRLLGYDEAEFIGLPIARIFRPEDIARGIPADELKQARDCGTASDDRWLVRKDGYSFWASGVATSLWDNGGRLLGYAKVLRDLTAQKEIQDRLAHSEAALSSTESRLRMALKAARVGTWRWDLRTLTDTLDENVSRLLGLGPGDTITTFDDFLARLHPEDRERTRAAFLDAVRQRNGLLVEFRVLSADGSVRWLRDTGETILDANGEARYLAGAVVDITAQREADERVRQSQRMDAVGQLAGGVAHEVNNMMTVVLGFTEFALTDFAADDPRRQDLERVRTAAGRAATVTAQLLAFSRRQMLQPTVLTAGEIVDSMTPVVKRAVGEHTELVIRRAPDEHPVMADRGQLEQVLLNLILNARDAMQQGGRLSIETANVTLDSEFASQHPEAEMRTGPFVQLVVRDTGHGMHAQTLRRVFEPFFTTKPTGQGTGLGLAVVYGIVKQSGGYIWAESEPGQGTTFTIYLPAAPPKPEPPAEQPPTAMPTSDGDETILVVEDELMVRQLMVRQLERLGYKCLEAGDGLAGIEVVKAALGRGQQVNLVITDLIMPRMNGRELADNLEHLQPGIPILFTSGYTDDEMMRRGLLAPGAEFIQKPFETAQFATALRTLLKHSVPGTHA